jgi:hypothetical protein
MYRGDDHVLTVAADQPLDDASEIIFTVRRRLRDDSPMQVAKLLTEGDVAVDYADATAVEVTMAAVDTIDLEAGYYAWDLQSEDTYGLIHTAARGRLHLRADVTHPEVS